MRARLRRGWTRAAWRQEYQRGCGLAARHCASSGGSASVSPSLGIKRVRRTTACNGCCPFAWVEKDGSFGFDSVVCEMVNTAAVHYNCRGMMTSTSRNPRD